MNKLLKMIFSELERGKSMKFSLKRSLIILIMLLLFKSNLLGQNYHVQIPEVKITSTQAKVMIPILVEEDLRGQEIYSYTAHINWDSSILKNPVLTINNCITQVWGTENLLPNVKSPDKLIISQFAATPALAGSDTLIKITFEVSGNPGDTTQINLDFFVFNDIPANMSGGSLKINQPPLGTALTISPPTPKTSSDLVLNYQFSDPDGDSEGNSVINWLKNNVIQPDFHNSSTVAATATQKGQSWRFSVVPADQLEIGPEIHSAEITIGNTAPTATSLTISPGNPLESNNLQASYLFQDVDNDLESNSELRWYKNDELQAVYNDQLIIPAAAIKVTENWYFTIKPGDGTDFGAVQTSAKVTIGAINHLPTVTNLEITPVEPRTTNELVANYVYSDPDNDPEGTSEIHWYKNSNLLPTLDHKSAVPANLTSKGELWYFSIRPFDGKEFGEQKNSPQVTILNSPPKAVAPVLNPLKPTELDDLHATYTYVDPDSDLEAGTRILWYKNDIHQPDLNDLLTVPTGKTAGNEQWFFTVEPKDSLDFGTTVTSPVVTIQQLTVTANFSATPITGTEPLKVQFKDLSTGPVNQWYWNFGDGQFSIEQSPMHEYTAHKQPYTVSLTVAYSGGTNTLTQDNYISVYPKLWAVFKAFPIVGKPDLWIRFQNESIGQINSYSWFFGDGTEQIVVGEKQHPTHAYKHPGAYTVALTVVNNDISNLTVLQDLVFIDEGASQLELVSSGKTVAGSDWNNVIDQDVFTDSGKVVAEMNQAWAVFTFADSSARKITRIRIKRAIFNPFNTVRNQAKAFEIRSSAVEGTLTAFKPLLSGELQDDEWADFQIPDSTIAKYFFFKVLSNENTSQDTTELAEIQIFGLPTESTVNNEKALNHNSTPPINNILTANYPNPFNSETLLEFQLTEQAQVQLTIYNLQGQQVKTLTNSVYPAGTHRVRWNGCDHAENLVESGTYFCRLSLLNQQQESTTFTRKLLLLK